MKVFYFVLLGGFHVVMWVTELMALHARGVDVALTGVGPIGRLTTAASGFQIRFTITAISQSLDSVFGIITAMAEFFAFAGYPTIMGDFPYNGNPFAPVWLFLSFIGASVMIAILLPFARGLLTAVASRFGLF